MVIRWPWWPETVGLKSPSLLSPQLIYESFYYYLSLHIHFVGQEMSEKNMPFLALEVLFTTMFSTKVGAIISHIMVWLAPKGCFHLEYVCAESQHGHIYTNFFLYEIHFYIFIVNWPIHSILLGIPEFKKIAKYIWAIALDCHLPGQNGISTLDLMFTTVRLIYTFLSSLSFTSSILERPI